MVNFIVGFVCGVVAVPTYWIFCMVGSSLIPAWKENPFAGFLGLALFISTPLSLVANLHQANIVGLVVGVTASGLWFYRITKSKPKNGGD